MFPPDRMIAHNLTPSCPRDSALCAYMDREWNASPAYLRDGGSGDGDREAAERPVGLLTRILRISRARVRQPHM